MPLINCEINLILTLSESCVLSDAPNQETKFAITDTKIYVPVVTLSTQNDAKLLQQLKYGFKSTINWNKYQSQITGQAVNWYLDYLIDPSFQGINKLFVLSFENVNDIIGYTEYFLPTIETKWLMDETFLINQ